MVVAARRPPAKKALIIANRYICFEKINPDMVLTATHKDASRLRRLLIERFGYKKEDIVVLMDTPEDKNLLVTMGLDSNDNFAPTRDNIIKAMENLVAEAQPGDRFVFHFSGHGGQIQNYDGTEEDGYDEVIYPSDVVHPFEEDLVDNFIIDDDIKRILVDRLPPKSRLVIIFDCCHSGTAADLPNTNDDFCPATPLTARIAASQSLGIALNPGFTSTFTITPSVQGKEILSTRFTDSISMPYVTSWSACKDNQQTFEDEGKGGIFGRAFVRALAKKPRQKHSELLRSVTRELTKITKRANEGREQFDHYVAPRPQIGSLGALEDLYDVDFEL